MKQLTFGLAALLLVAVSCNKESHFETTTTYRATNLVIPTAPGAEPVVTAGTYSVKMVNGSVDALSTQDLKINGMETSFTTGPLETKSGSTNAGSLFTVSGSGGNVSGLPITGIKGSFTGILNYVYRPVIGINTVQPANYGPLVFLDYTIGDKFRVRTLGDDMYFSGTTTTEYNYRGEDKTYENTGILYRVVFSKNFNTASVIIYDGRFAAEQPEQAIYDYLLLKDLPVTWSASGYSIQAQDVIPLYQEGSVLEPQNRYVFNNISLRSNADNLANVTASFQVAGMYKGRFEGLCAVTTLW